MEWMESSWFSDVSVLKISHFNQNHVPSSSSFSFSDCHPLLSELEIEIHHSFHPALSVYLISSSSTFLSCHDDVCLSKSLMIQTVSKQFSLFLLSCHSFLVLFCSDFFFSMSLPVLFKKSTMTLRQLDGRFSGERRRDESRDFGETIVKMKEGGGETLSILERSLIKNTVTHLHKYHFVSPKERVKDQNRHDPIQRNEICMFCC